MALPEQCPFCNLQRERDRLLHDGEGVWVILSNPRLVPGHCLVIPKRHIENVTALTPEERREIFDVLILFEEKVLAHASGCDIRQNYRPFIPQNDIKVDHLHFHLIPREFEDELYRKAQRFERELFQPLGGTEQRKFMELWGVPSGACEGENFMIQ